jgi:hypothetical protein
MTDTQKQWSKEQEAAYRKGISDQMNNNEGALLISDLTEEVQLLRAQLASLTQQSEANKEGWISVNERLPADESFKMIWIRGESRPKNAWFGRGIKQWFDEDDNTWSNTAPDNRFATVTHWRELPPPPLSQPSPVEAQEKK